MSSLPVENISDDDAISVSIAENTNVMPIAKTMSVTLTDAGGGGDCFYLSIHDALESQGYKDAFITAFGAPSEKNRFVQRLRTLVSNEAEGALKKLYKELCNKAASSPADFTALLGMGALPNWLPPVILKYINIDNLTCLDNDNEQMTLFVSEVQGKIVTMGNWAGELEKNAAKSVLARVGVYLEVKNRIMPRLALIPGRIVLSNMGEMHYRYYRYNMRGGRKTRNNRKNRRAVRTKAGKSRRSNSFTRVRRALY